MGCRDCEKVKICRECFSLIDGVALQRTLPTPRLVIIETCDGQKISGKIFLVSPVGLGVEIRDLVPGPWYLLNIQDDFRLKIRKIGGRGKDNCYGFDILEVQRNGISTTRLNNEEYKVLTMTNEQLVDEITENLPDDVKTIVQEQLKTELEKAKIFDSIKVGQAMKYQKGNLKLLSKGTEKIAVPERELATLAEKCGKTGLPQRELYVDNDKMYDIHGIPFDYQSGGILLLDVTCMITKERELKKKELQIYREAIEAVTGGKLLLIERKELAFYNSGIKPDMQMKVESPKEIDAARRAIEEMLKDIGMPENEIFTFLVCVSEAVTNALKHANGGKCSIWLKPDRIQVLVSDTGQGISFKDLPKATLMNCFSTTKSLGCGFTIMLRFTDKVILTTDSDGTTVIMERILSGK